jgi:hypothetical protein
MPLPSPATVRPLLQPAGDGLHRQLHPDDGALPRSQRGARPHPGAALRAAGAGGRRRLGHACAGRAGAAEAVAGGRAALWAPGQAESGAAAAATRPQLPGHCRGAGGSLLCSPLPAPQALGRYLSAVTCKPWPQDLRGAMAASRGKLLLELVEALSGRAVPVKVRFGWVKKLFLDWHAAAGLHFATCASFSCRLTLRRARPLARPRRAEGGPQ